MLNLHPENGAALRYDPNSHQAKVSNQQIKERPGSPPQDALKHCYINKNINSVFAKFVFV